MDTATLVESGGDQIIDPDLFLDASLYPIGAVGAVYISSIDIVTPRNATITVSDSTRRPKASVTFDPLFAPNLLRLADEWGRPAGVLVSDSIRLSRLSSWSPIDHAFATTDTEFVPSCVIPTPEVGVRGLITERDELFAKDALIIGDNGVVVTQAEDEIIRVDIVGDVLFIRETCGVVDKFTTPNFIRTINDCPPDPNGNYNITVGDHQNEETIVRVYPLNGVLVIEAIGKTVI
jgi:hypothetical protein